MKATADSKSRDILFYCSLMVSIVLHLLILYPRTGEEKSVPLLPSKKAGFTFINFSIDDNGQRNEIDHSKRKNNEDNSNINRKGELNSVKTGAKKNSSSGSPGSFSKDPVKLMEKSYESKILSRIQRMKYYPLTARRMNQEGVVVVKFRLKKDGTLAGSVKVVKGCEYELLNRAGVKTIYRSLPFPSFPDLSISESIEFNVQLVYNLKTEG